MTGCELLVERVFFVVACFGGVVHGRVHSTSKS